MGRTVLLRHGGHVDDGRRRRAEGNPAESGRNHTGFVITPHAAEHHKIGVENRQQHLQGQGAQNEHQRPAELP
ncbi:hypothetical protein D9M71_720100 [compost metagenome]